MNQVVKAMASNHSIFCSICNGSLSEHNEIQLIQCALDEIKRGEKP